MLIAGTKVVVNKNCKLKHLRGRLGVVVDEPDETGYWGVFLRSKGSWAECEVWFSEDMLTVKEQHGN